MKTVATFLNPEEAKVARSFLAAQGIDAIIAGEESLSVMPHIGMGAKSYQLMVADEDEAQAKRLLAEIESTPETKPESAVSQPVSLKRIMLGLALLVSVLFLFFGNSYSRDAVADEGPGIIDYITCWVRSAI